MRVLLQRIRLAASGLDDRLWLPSLLATHSDAVFRISLSPIFIVGGLGHFVELDAMLERIDESPWKEQVTAIGDPAILLWVSGGLFVFFGLCLAVGFVRRLSALILFVTLVPITLSIHIAPGHIGPLLKNVAIMGALLLIYSTRGGGR